MEPTHYEEGPSAVYSTGEFWFVLISFAVFTATWMYLCWRDDQNKEK